MAAAVARYLELLPPAGGARRNSRRPFCCRVFRRAIRHARSRRIAARCAPQAAGAAAYVSLSAADPLNLIGILTPGARLASLGRQSAAVPRWIAGGDASRGRDPLSGRSACRRNSGKRRRRCCAVMLRWCWTIWNCRRRRGLACEFDRLARSTSAAILRPWPGRHPSRRPSASINATLACSRLRQHLQMPFARRSGAWSAR